MDILAGCHVTQAIPGERCFSVSVSSANQWGQASIWQLYDASGLVKKNKNKIKNIVCCFNGRRACWKFYTGPQNKSSHCAIAWLACLQDKGEGCGCQPGSSNTRTINHRASLIRTTFTQRQKKNQLICCFFHKHGVVSRSVLLLTKPLKIQQYTAMKTQSFEWTQHCNLVLLLLLLLVALALCRYHFCKYAFGL